ncbi:transcription repressor NadR [Sinanaerobacter chloroacetimidivorans]|jgi:transcriptional regulator of NAD metabolism|uniref:Transcription repressor NadR n=1 Tax=Sinanaerobacter chloroacetimidivorans TaxID=2818044 RepID=A0A8J7W5H5_9FIRM|nr:transcription repressor NadR [Sinanaerobacter chloroacetimidivorans]MBR0599565.1 transcription repressor NadR [Sinanaerobacter chloroacetimidivorans]
MSGEERRKKIIELLKKNQEPISGGELSKLLGVTRQVIVQDIALLRAVNRNILSTTKGYLLYYQEDQKVNRCFMVKHTNDQIEDELCTIVDAGGKILDVIVMHDIYGEISSDLIIKTRQDVADFISKLRNQQTVPLKELTGGVHLHTVEADSETMLDRIEMLLKSKGYLIEN